MVVSRAGMGPVLGNVPRVPWSNFTSIGAARYAGVTLSWSCGNRWVLADAS